MSKEKSAVDPVALEVINFVQERYERHKAEEKFEDLKALKQSKEFTKAHNWIVEQLNKVVFGSL